MNSLYIFCRIVEAQNCIEGSLYKFPLQLMTQWGIRRIKNFRFFFNLDLILRWTPNFFWLSQKPNPKNIVVLNGMYSYIPSAKIGRPRIANTRIIFNFDSSNCCKIPAHTFPDGTWALGWSGSESKANLTVQNEQLNDLLLRHLASSTAKTLKTQ